MSLESFFHELSLINGLERGLKALKNKASVSMRRGPLVHGKVIGLGRHLMVFISEQRNRNWLDVLCMILISIGLLSISS